MFKHILVPLDGSLTAEVVLPVAAYLADTLHARVTVIHVIETDAPPLVHGERHLTRQEDAEAYLADIGQRFFPKDKVTCHVHTTAMKDVSQGIALHEAELAPDLIIMCTHGRGSLRGLLFGRIAQQVVASGNLPVLLIRPEFHPPDQAYTCHKVLVPTDGKAVHVQGLVTALDLACATGARLDLLTVVPTLFSLSGRHVTTQRFAPGTTQAILELEAADHKKQLLEQTERCRSLGVSVDTHLQRGEPVAVITKIAETLNVDLIVMGTHGKAGAKAFWSGSVGAGVLTRTFRPVLLVPIPAVE